jgi:hypothetical protein
MIVATMIKETGERTTVVVKDIAEFEVLIAKEYGIPAGSFEGVFFKDFPGKHYIVVPASNKRAINKHALKFLSDIGVKIGRDDKQKMRGIVIHASEADEEFCKNAPGGWVVRITPRIKS